MVSAVKWEGAPSGSSFFSGGASLGDNTLSSAGSAFDNSGNLNTLFWLEFAFAMNVSADDATPTLDLYVTMAPDGTNYSTAPLTGGVGAPESLLCSCPVKTGTSAQRHVLGPFLLPPFKLIGYIDNQTGEAIDGSGVTVTAYPANYESQ